MTLRAPLRAVLLLLCVAVATRGISREALLLPSARVSCAAERDASHPLDATPPEDTEDAARESFEEELEPSEDEPEGGAEEDGPSLTARRRRWSATAPRGPRGLASSPRTPGAPRGPPTSRV